MVVSSGVEDRLVHIPTDRGNLYSHLLLPRDATAYIVICSSILGEFEANYHRERLLANALASVGIAAVRFHYAGEGNSFGERSLLTLDSMIDDARSVGSYVAALGYARRGYLGTRLGCFAASALGSSDPDAPLVLWEPIDDATAILRDAKRKRLMSGLSQGHEATLKPLDVEGQVDGPIDLFGYDIYRPLLESLERRSLLDQLSNAAGPIFVGRFRSMASRDPVADRLVELGISVDRASFDLAEAWWYQSEHEPASEDLVPMTTAWILSVLGDRDSRGKR